MRYPKVIFIQDKNLDKEIGAEFLNDKIGSYDFGKDRIVSVHPAFSKWRKLGKKELYQKVDEYVDTYYTMHGKEIGLTLVKMQEMWDGIAEKYFEGLKDIFGTLSFYSPKRIDAKLSIFKCGIVEDNLTGFQIWYETVSEPAEVRRHIAHEILHFFYYAYLRSHGNAKLAEDWDLAEIFNRIILNESNFSHLTGKQDVGYSIHTRRVPKYRKIWKESTGIDQYLEKLSSERSRR